jgi:hypothetical protein
MVGAVGVREVDNYCPSAMEAPLSWLPILDLDPESKLTMSEPPEQIFTREGLLAFSYD